MPRAEAIAAAREAVHRSRDRLHPPSPDRGREWRADDRVGEAGRSPGPEPRRGAEPEPRMSRSRGGGAPHLLPATRQREEEDEEPGPGDGSEPGRVGGGFFVEQEGERGTRTRLPLRERWGLALEDRLPTWLRLRCGIEPKTLVALSLVLLVAVGFAVHHFWTGRPQGVAVPSAESAPAGDPTARPPGGGSPAPGSGGVPAASSSASPGKRLVVDVSGKVRDPGIHRLPAGSRVTDALEAAGGLRKGADTSGLNRARLLVDGEQIVVGKPGKGGAAAPPGAAGGGGASTGAASGGPAAPISLSAATPEQLETLPGVGPVLAQHIVDYRTEHGGFTSVDQLKEVNGIGEKRFADIKPKVTP
ncbi:helix-hairpin-helix domain-containing protein [Streptomyces sp. PU-14G]|uniref:helix-hairpin-helix domain-containing protein n=1 Tax=Streptomyces sp. PU-14G TaxID=2800808 RepID=UPI0034E05648